MVKEAVKALEEEVQKILYIPEAEKWHKDVINAV